MKPPQDDEEIGRNRDALEGLPSEALAGYLIELQGDLDGLTERAERLQARIEKLEADREVLRDRLEAERDRNTLERAARKLRRTPPRPPADIEPEPSTVPGREPTSVAAARPDLTVASILDPISAACFAPEVRLVNLSRTAWVEQLETHTPDLLLVESAFAGSERSWRHRIAHFGEPHPALQELVAWCRGARIPTVFWCKEDPINYGLFVGSASLFDYVFTVDALSLDRYRTDLGHARIGVLPFAAQPTLHHLPASDGERTGSVAFAGSYYGYKHDERRRQMSMILDPARPYGLEIYDRMAGIADPRFDWPQKYRPHIIGNLPYHEIVEVYRHYRVFLNVNTVTDSPTMCARRIFELAACGTPVVSGPSLAIERMAPPEVVHVSESAEQTAQALRRILDDPAVRAEAAHSGPAWIANGNTYSDRVDALLSAIG